MCCAFAVEKVARCTKAAECLPKGHRRLCLADTDCNIVCAPPEGIFDHPICLD